ncbi:XdhC family protein [Gilvimarinus sp. F26214L]|uniref:XdhC family protein n=1 Tax=Gilvimarinus sp. DZF01 TaxID=3461371 RepID=UPI00404659D5
MYSLDLEVFPQLIEWLERGIPAWLCTVTSTWGSAPRDVGSLMACNAEGQQCGSLSGGCIEEDLLEKITRGEVSSRAPQHLLYGATREEAERLQLPCGGTLGVLLEPLAGADDLAWLKTVQQHIEKRECITRAVDYVEGTSELKPGGFGGQFAFSREDAKPLSLRQVYGPQYHLFLVGISEVSRALATFALLMDYRVTVCDPRPEQVANWDVDDARVIRAMPDDAVGKYANDSRSAVLALTHDPRIDDMGLMEAFNTEAFYIGAMGSKRTSDKRRQRLKLLDITEGDLQRLHAPIGLDIGSKTPAEIAIAILAELTRVRAATRDTE